MPSRGTTHRANKLAGKDWDGRHGGAPPLERELGRAAQRHAIWLGVTVQAQSKPTKRSRRIVGAVMYACDANVGSIWSIWSAGVASASLPASLSDVSAYFG